MINTETLTAEKIRSFETTVKVCADDVSKLRSCDVYRAIAAEHYNGSHEVGTDAQVANTKSFIAWLRSKRPDLEEKIAEAITWIEDEEGVILH